MGPPKFLALALAWAIAWVPLASGATGRAHRQDVAVCTFNVWHNLPDRTVAREVHRLAPSCGLIGLQEAGGPTARALTPAGWAVVRPTRARSLPITYRVGTWAREASGAVLAHRSGLFASATRYLTWVRLRARATGLAVTVVNVHAIPHVEYRGHPRHLPRLALYRLWLERLGALVAAHPGPVLVLGDFNVAHGPDCRVGYRWFPCRWGRRHHLVNVWSALGGGRGTHGRRTIDYALDRSPRITPQSRRVLYGYPSDHRPVVVRYRLTR